MKSNSGLDNLLWEMEGAKPRKGEHVPLFECFAETEDPDVILYIMPKLLILNERTPNF